MVLLAIRESQGPKLKHWLSYTCVFSLKPHKKKKKRYTCLMHIEKCYVYNIFLTNPKYQVVISSYYWGKKIILVDIYIYIYIHTQRLI